jgi:hypothetical protein
VVSLRVLLGIYLDELAVCLMEPQESSSPVSSQEKILIQLPQIIFNLEQVLPNPVFDSPSNKNLRFLQNDLSCWAYGPIPGHNNPETH